MTTLDAAYEFDAPQFYDFRRTSVGTSEASLWFRERPNTPDRIALQDVANTEQPQTVNKPDATATKAAAAAEAPAPEPTPARSGPTTATRNIVTSWGTTAASKKQAAPSNPAAGGKENAGPSNASRGPAKASPPKSALKTRQVRLVEPVVASAPAPRQPSAAPAKAAAPPAAAPVPAAAAPAPAEQPRRKSVKIALPAAAPDESPERPKIKPPSPRITRSVTKKRLEEAALQHAETKAKDTRAKRTIKTALSNARSGRASTDGKAQGMKSAAAANAPSARDKVRAGAAKTALAKPKAKPVLNKLAGAVVKPTQANKVVAKRNALPAAAAAPARARGAAGAAGPSRAAVAGAGVRKPVAVGVRVRRPPPPAPRVPARSTKPLTMPQEPNLRTQTRTHTAAGPSALPSKSPFKPLVVKVKEFETKTPPRFKRKPEPVPPSKEKVPPLTHPQEPVLITNLRARPSRLKPTSVMEEEEMAAMPVFKAQPVRPEVLAGAAALPAPRTDRKLTEPRPFNFVSDDRAARRQQRDAAAGPSGAGAAAGAAGPSTSQWKATPYDPSIFEAKVPLAKKARMSLTVPMSPLLLTKKTRAHELKWEQEKFEFKARPVPSFLHVPPEFNSSAPGPAPLTAPQPFNLRTEQRGQTHQQKLQAKLTEEEAAAEAARRVRAQGPPPTLGVPVVPPRPVPRPLTVPQPFALQSEVRHGEYTKEMSEQLAAQEAHAQAEREFKARPMWRGAPYQPLPNDAPLTAPLDPHLATEQRAAERSEFDKAVAEKIRQQEAEKAAAAEAAARAEEEAVREYRRSLRFKAKPAPTFEKPKPPAPSTKPLTKPKTPNLGRKRKADE